MNYLLTIAAFLGFTSVLFGAYGDHALQPHFSAADLTSWKTALYYHQLYAVILLVLAGWYWLPNSKNFKALHAIASIFTLGVIFFSGGIYLKVWAGYSQLVWLIPLGGTLLMAGWFLMLVASIMMWRK